MILLTVLHADGAHHHPLTGMATNVFESAWRCLRQQGSAGLIGAVIGEAGSDESWTWLYLDWLVEMNAPDPQPIEAVERRLRARLRAEEKQKEASAAARKVMRGKR